MIDVFLRWYPQNDLRLSLGYAVWERLKQFPDIHLVVLQAEHIAKPFHIVSKRQAEEEAQSEIYCVMDDDQLPLIDNFFYIGKTVLETRSDYGMIAGFPLEYERHGQPYAARTETVVEAHSIGCPYFVRKGTLTHFPDSPIHMYDGDLSKVVTDQGLKTGFARYAIYNHLGYGFSQVEHVH
jgi:hypothetical protein